MIQDGFYDNISITEYHADKTYFSSSSLKKAKKSLKLFKQYIDGLLDDDRKSHFDFGNAFELALLDPETFKRDVLIYDAAARPEKDKTITSKINQEWKNQVLATSKYVIKADGKESYAAIEEMLRACYADAVIQKLIKNIEYQYSMFWTDPRTGLRLKSRPDVCKSKKNVIVDLKTTLDGSPEKFSKDLSNYDYPFQATMQINGVIETGFMDKVDAYYWLVVEKEPPYSATLYEFDADDRAYCQSEYEYVLHCVSEALQRGHFPSYSYRADNKYGILRAAIPLWYKNFGM